MQGILSIGYDEATESFLLNDGHGLGPEAPDLESASEKLARLRSRSNGGHPHSKGVRKKLDEKNEAMRVFKDTIPRDKLMGKVYRKRTKTGKGNVKVSITVG